MLTQTWCERQSRSVTAGPWRSPPNRRTGGWDGGAWEAGFEQLVCADSRNQATAHRICLKCALEALLGQGLVRLFGERPYQKRGNGIKLMSNAHPPCEFTLSRDGPLRTLTGISKGKARQVPLYGAGRPISGVGRALGHFQKGGSAHRLPFQRPLRQGVVLLVLRSESRAHKPATSI